MKYLEELKGLNLPSDQYAVFGSGPLAIRGIRENKDIDIIAKPGLWDKLSREYGKDDGSIEIGHVEVYRNWDPLPDSIEKLIDGADIIGGIRFVKLKYLLEWKKSVGREKDKRDIKLIEDYVKKNSVHPADKF